MSVLGQASYFNGSWLVLVRIRRKTVYLSMGVRGTGFASSIDELDVR